MAHRFSEYLSLILSEIVDDLMKITLQKVKGLIKQRLDRLKARLEGAEDIYPRENQIVGCKGLVWVWEDIKILRKTASDA